MAAFRRRRCGSGPGDWPCAREVSALKTSPISSGAGAKRLTLSASSPPECFFMSSPLTAPFSIRVRGAPEGPTSGEQRVEAGLAEVVVGREHVHDPAVLHGEHGGAIDEAPALVGTLAVEVECTPELPYDLVIP